MQDPNLIGLKGKLRRWWGSPWLWQGSKDPTGCLKTWVVWGGLWGFGGSPICPLSRTTTTTPYRRRSCWERPGLFINSILSQLALCSLKLFNCLEGKSITPHWGEYCSLLFFPATLSSWSRIGEELLELTRPQSRLVCCSHKIRETRMRSVSR